MSDMAESAPRARTRRWSGPLPEPVMEALELLQELGHGDKARAALAALKPPKKIGRPVTLTPEEAMRTANAFRLRWREDPELTVYQASKAISKLYGGTLSPQAIRDRLDRYCANIGKPVEQWADQVRAEECEQARWPR